MVEQQSDAPRVAQVLVHGQPHVETEIEQVRQDRNQIRIARRHAVLADADADAGADRRELADIAVAAIGEQLARHRLAANADRLQRGIVAVHAHHRMRSELCRGLRHAVPREIVALRIEPDADCPDAARHKCGLLRPHHPHRDVGVAPQQVLVAVRQRELERDARMGLAKPPEHRREHLDADDLAGGEPHRPALTFRLARSRPQQVVGGGRHRLSVRDERKCQRRRLQPVLRAGEERRAERSLERIDVAAEGRLRQAQRTGRGR